MNDRIVKLLLALSCMVCLSLSLKGQGIPSFYTALEQHHEKEEYEACLGFNKQVDAFIVNRHDTIASNTIYYVADAYYQLGKTDDAILWREKQKALLRGTEWQEEYSTVLYNLMQIYVEAGAFVKAGTVAAELLEADKKLYAVTSEEYIGTAQSVYRVYFQLDRLKEAEQLLQTTIRQQERGAVNRGILLNDLGDLYTYKGEFNKAYEALAAAQAIFKKELAPDAGPYLNSCVNMGILLMQQGKYADAEEQFDTALKALPSEEASYLPTLNNQALVYQKLGQYERAEQTFQKIGQLEVKSLGASHPDYAVTLTNIGAVYIDEGKYAEAEKSLLEALAIQKKNNEANTASYARKLNNLAKVYTSSGEIDKAIPRYEQALAILKKAVGENNADYATVSYNLGLAYLKKGNAQAGVKFLKSSAAIRAQVLGKKHPKYAESKEKLAEYQWQQKQKKEARVTFQEVFDNYYFQMETIFPALTEEEKSKFYYNTLKASFDKFNSFAVDFCQQEPAVLGDLYNHQINTKAVIMLATEKMKQSILNSKNTALIRQFEEWQLLKEQIAKAYSQGGGQEEMDSLVNIANAKEKELARQSDLFAKQIVKKRLTWQEIQKTLKPGEAAIEVVRFNNFTPELGGKFAEQVTYAMLILTEKTKQQPDLVVLSNGTELEGRYLKFHRNTILLKQEDNYSYKNCFGALADYLRKNQITQFYFSPDGVYNQINLNTIKDTNTGKYLIDEFTIRQVTNSRELTESKTAGKSAASSMLIGFPKFNMEEEKVLPPKGESRSLSRGAGLNRSLRGGLTRYINADNGISVLPGTRQEIKDISGLFASPPAVFTEDQASEYLIKQSVSPRILHIATHGYFLQSEGSAPADGQTPYVPNPLLRSGLILAGAENFLRTGIPIDSTGGDGILTAYEAMNLQLDETELVVLSACETGLGETKNGEGVYGLQRALELGGAKHIVMSLWSVDDDATRLLMTYFYEDYLKSGDPHSALKKAQQKLMTTYPEPFYWGAFVVVGI